MAELHTIWEDAVAQTAEIQLAEVTAENLRKQKEEQERKEKEQKEREAQKQAGLGRNEVQLSGKENCAVGFLKCRFGQRSLRE